MRACVCMVCVQIFVTQNGHRHQSHVYMTSSQHRTRDASHVKGGRTMSWTSFAFSGQKVTVEVHAPHDFNHCIVRPKSYGFNCRRTGNKVRRQCVTCWSVPLLLCYIFHPPYLQFYPSVLFFYKTLHLNNLICTPSHAKYTVDRIFVDALLFLSCFTLGEL